MGEGCVTAEALERRHAEVDAPAPTAARPRRASVTQHGVHLVGALPVAAQHEVENGALLRREFAGNRRFVHHSMEGAVWRKDCQLGLRASAKNRLNPPSPVWDFPKSFPTAKKAPANRLFSTSSTSWGSLVRAQCRPPHESPAAVGFLVSERIGVRVRGGVAAEWLRTTLRSPGQRSTRVTRADNRTPGYWVTAWPDRVRRAKLLA